MAFRTELEDFAQLYERTYQAVFRTTLGICGDASLAADVTQDAYESAYRQQARFRGDVPAEAWLHRIAVNAALTALRRRRVRWTEPIDPIRHDRPTFAPDGIDTIAVCDAVARLDPRQRAAVVLRYYHGFDYATIASILQTSTSNVGALLSRALVRLRSELDPTGRTPMSAISTSTEVGRGR